MTHDPDSARGPTLTCQTTRNCGAGSRFISSFVAVCFAVQCVLALTSAGAVNCSIRITSVYPISLVFIIVTLSTAVLAAFGRSGLESEINVPVRYAVLVASLHVALVAQARREAGMEKTVFPDLDYADRVPGTFAAHAKVR
jgi:hypothetical protein